MARQSRKSSMYKMSPTTNNVSDLFFNYIQPYYSNNPSNDNHLTDINKITANYAIIDKYELNNQTTLFAGDSAIDDLLATAFASGATDYLKSQGFPNSYQQYYMDDLKSLLNMLPNPVNVNLQVSLSSNPTLSPTRGPIPTQGCSTCKECQECEKCEKITTAKQAYFSLLGALVFLLLSLPIVYRLTDVVFGSIGANTMSENGAPTYFGLFLHFAVYFVIIFGLMKLFEKKKN